MTPAEQLPEEKRALFRPYAKTMYDAYGDSVGWKSVTGSDMPSFENVGARVEGAWCMAVEGLFRRFASMTPEEWRYITLGGSPKARGSDSEARNPNEAVAPIPMRIPCPSCHQLHIDKGRFETEPHETHACQHCGMVWKPARVPTVGVQFLPGYKDT